MKPTNMKTEKAMPYKIDKNVPIPKGRANGVGIFSFLRSLKPGESFTFPIKERNTMSSASGTLKRAGGFDYRIKKISDTHCRLWKLAMVKRK